MPPKLNRQRALFVLTKIDEILAWEQRKDTERDTKFVELGRYLCEVRAGQYWRLGNLKSFDEFLERRFPESRRKAYYLMSIHEHLPPQVKRELKAIGWTKGRELAKLARRDGQCELILIDHFSTKSSCGCRPTSTSEPELSVVHCVAVLLLRIPSQRRS